MYKILVIAPTPFFADRGCHVRILEESRELERLGNRVRICTYFLGRDIPGLVIHRTSRIPWYRKLEAGPSYPKLILDAMLGGKAMRLVRDFKPDIIHAHLHEGCLLGIALRRFFKRPLVFDYQGSLSEEALEHGFVSRGSLGHSALAGVERRLNRSADLVFTSSEYLRARITGLADPSRAKALGDGVDLKLFKPEGDSKDLRDELGIPHGAPVVVFLGLLNRYQGVDLLLEAVRMVTGRSPHVYFLVMGYPDEEKYAKKARRMGVDECTRFPGRIDYFKASKYLSLGSIAVAPKISRTESNGKLLNYMACGLPVAAFDTPANRELLGDNAAYAGLTVFDPECSDRRGDEGSSPKDLQDAKNLAEKIIELLEDEGLRSGLAERGRKRTEEKFGWDRIGRKMMKFYEELFQ